MSEAHSITALIEPEVGIPIIIWMGWLLVALGALKLLFYWIGEKHPKAWDSIKSPTMKSLFTGKGNRLLFGLGGIVTIFFGFVFIGIAYLARYLLTLIDKT